MYTDPNDPALYANSGFYAGHDRPQIFELQSLEQIASEVLDMNGNHDEGFSAQDQEPSHFDSLNHGASAGVLTIAGDAPKPDGSVDSAISLGAADSVGKGSPDASSNPPLQPEMDPTSTEQGEGATESIEIARPPTATSSHGINSLPLYKPPPPPSLSPELSKRQPLQHNGISGQVDSSPKKRKRDAQLEVSHDMSAKKHNTGLSDRRESGSLSEKPKLELIADKESLELAKALQQDDLGLRKRNK